MIKVFSQNHAYGIEIGRGLLSSLGRYCSRLSVGKDAFIVTNARVKRAYGGICALSLKEAGFTVSFCLVGDSEKSKSLAVCGKVLERLAGFDRGKRPFIVALGGGVVGDLAGFCAAVYKRGIPYVQVPTTLLAQVDSSIGGKTAVDLKAGKNLAGAFYPPRLVVTDVELLASLPRRQLVSGMAEVVKYGVISDPGLFRRLEADSSKILAGGLKELEYCVERCARIKAAIVSRDEREEKGLRTILNFGHTVGHAVEAASCYSGITHGEAISIGMACACSLSVRLGLLDGANAARVENALRLYGLPVMAGNTLTPRLIIEPLFRDKKFKGKNRFVLLRDIGRPVIVDDVSPELIREVVRARIRS
jgi:3-dehydroquinate synthase